MSAASNQARAASRAELARIAAATGGGVWCRAKQHLNERGSGYCRKCKAIRQRERAARLRQAGVQVVSSVARNARRRELYAQRRGKHQQA